ncbi:hypothetical protein F07S3_28250 [Bradyrhizobium diazoefficiens]|nr:hypothetical protein F07S3_28250 [Bradyrhizobium diazoefficiens]
MRAASRAEAIATSGAGAASPRITAGAATGRGALDRRCCARDRRRGGDFRQAVYRLLRKRAVDTGLQIEGEKLSDGGGGFGDHAKVRLLYQFGAPCIPLERISVVVLSGKIGNKRAQTTEDRLKG